MDRSRRQGGCRTGPVLHLPVRHAGDECSQLQHLRGKALPGQLQGQASGLVLQLLQDISKRPGKYGEIWGKYGKLW